MALYVLQTGDVKASLQDCVYRDSAREPQRSRPEICQDSLGCTCDTVLQPHDTLELADVQLVITYRHEKLLT